MKKILFAFFLMIAANASAHYCYHVDRQWEVQCQPIRSSVDPVNLSQAISFAGFNQVRADFPECLQKEKILNGYRSDVFFNTFNAEINNLFKTVLHQELQFVTNTENSQNILTDYLYVNRGTDFNNQLLQILSESASQSGLTAVTELPLRSGQPVGTAHAIVKNRDGQVVSDLRFEGCVLIEGQAVEKY